MPLFVITGLDKANALELRMATREAHLAFVNDRVDEVKLAGPLLTEGGDMAGSLFIIEAADLTAANAFSAADPYTRAGLWERVEITGFKVVRGQLA